MRKLKKRTIILIITQSPLFFVDKSKSCNDAVVCWVVTFMDQAGYFEL